LRSRAFAPLLTNGSAKPISWCNEATARASRNRPCRRLSQNLRYR
jgi:hypothetical protein